MALDTRDKIVNALMELAEAHPNQSHFTITDIAKQAGLSRQAIYKKHFSSVEEITSYIRQTIMENFFPIYESYEQNTEENPFIFFSQEIIPVIYTHRRWTKVLYTTAVDPFWRDFLTNIFTQWITQNITIDSKKLGLSTEMSIELLVRWLNSMIELWIIQDDPIPADEFSEQFLKIISIPIDRFVIHKDQS